MGRAAVGDVLVAAVVSDTIVALGNVLGPRGKGLAAWVSFEVIDRNCGGGVVEKGCQRHEHSNAVHYS